MKTNRKIRPQPSLASLTADEYHRLADMVRTRTYDDILQQIVKPRAEGGFDLHISIKPLQVLHRRVTELDRVNKLIADGQKLTLTTYDELQAGQTPATEQIHNVILNATWRQVQYSENTPHQLLALQRLADFPTRSEIRENREQIYQEKHTHKIEMDTFRKEHATERLDLSKRSLNLREKTFALRHEQQPANHNPSFDTAHTPIPSAAVDDDDFDYENMPSISPNPLPPEVIARNLEFSRKLRAGKIIIDRSGPYVRAVELPDATNSTDAIISTDTTPLNTDHSSPSALSAKSAVTPALSTLNSLNSQPSTTEIPSASSADSASIPVPIPPLSPEDLAARVNHYTIRRAAEYVAYSRNIDPWPHRTPPPKFITEDRHCPCGHACPCPHHETPEKGGPFPEEFWSLSPFGFADPDHLFARDLPYRLPTEYLA